ncbi:GW dipeptide domain-containing protein, partial [Enterococcus canintestini]|uniref:GW dipeptide domain-containing protein n=5 Tax=Enterococcus TaxID=1350 RepID=UPI0028903598
NDANKQGVWSAPYNTENNIKYYGNGGQYVGQTVSITKVAKTPRSTYLQFTLNGKTMWMDKAGFNEQLYPIIENENMQVTGTIKTDTVAKSQGIWQAPWNTQITNQY